MTDNLSLQELDAIIDQLPDPDDASTIALLLAACEYRLRKKTILQMRRKIKKARNSMKSGRLGGLQK